MSEPASGFELILFIILLPFLSWGLLWSLNVLFGLDLAYDVTNIAAAALLIIIVE